MKRISWFFLVGAAAFLLTGAGCGGGPGVGRITGTVTLDGEPLADAIIQFWHRTDRKLGTLGNHTSTDGSFDVTPEPSAKVVAKPGEYVVTVSKFVDTKSDAVVKLGEGALMPLALIGQEGRLKSLVPERYQDKTTSPLSVRIQKGNNHFQLELISDEKQPGNTPETSPKR